MNKGLFFCATLLACLLTSCSTIKKTATTVDVVHGIYAYPTVADLEIKDKVEMRSSWTFRPFHIGEPNMKTVKGNLIAETLQQIDADVLLEPQVSFSKTSYGERVLQITGYPAKYKNFRKASSQELDAIKACNVPNIREKFNHSKGDMFWLVK